MASRRILDDDKISKLLLEENEEQFQDDATSDEEDVVEKDDAQDTDSATDDTDADPDWNPNEIHISQLDLICGRTKKRRYYEVCVGDLTDDDPDDLQPLETDSPVLSNEVEPPVEPIQSSMQQVETITNVFTDTQPNDTEPLVSTDTFYGQNDTQFSQNNIQINSISQNSSGTVSADHMDDQHEYSMDGPSTSSGRGRLSRGRHRTQGRRPTRGRSITPRNNQRGRGHSSSNGQTQPVDPPVEFHPSELNPLILVPNKGVVRGKDRTPWSTTAPKRQNVPCRNIVHIRPGPKNIAKNANTPRECFDLFFTPEMIGQVVTYTNQQIVRVRENYKEKNSTTATVNDEEMYAFLGLLLFSATMKNNHLSTKDMFNPKLCGSQYRAVMSKERFEFLCLTLRFDEKETRAERSKTDPLAPIRVLWELFVNNCRENYKPGPYVTIDEQLLAFRGKCRFRMYIPNKPAKYGLKLVMGCDTSTNYMFNAIPYVGKKTSTNNLPVAEYMVKEISRPLHGSNRNITCDNWFTSMKLVDDLLRPPYNLTYVGTIRSNKTELPNEVKNIKARPVGTSVFCFGSNKTLVSYKPKPNKVVLLISTMHDSAELNPDSNKPTIIHAYNKTKGAVDTLDQMCQNVSCSRKTRRWPLCMFYGMQNITYINAYVIYCLNTYSKNKTPMNRRKFNLELCNQLVSSHAHSTTEPTLAAESSSFNLRFPRSCHQS